MGEAKKREDAAQDGLAKLAEQAKANAGQIQLNLHQALVLHAAQRIAAAISVECAMLSELNHREAAGEFAGAAEHIQKYAARYLASTQSKVIVPKLVVEP